MKEEILQEILVEDHNLDTPFIEGLTNPERLIELAFWSKYGAAIVNILQTQVTNAEENARQKFLNGLPIKPLKPAVGDNKHKEVPVTKKEEEF